ncbi:hypothetical protein SESBI_04487 [Sesbania bispinosa]|nr:hypothetical protein SESBI_04487 [Sesbania bispinosa]
MASNNSFGLKDLLSPQPDSNLKPITRTMKPLVSSIITPIGPPQIESNTLSSPLSSSSPPSLQFSMDVASHANMSLNLVKGKQESENKNSNESHLERNLGKEKEEPFTNTKYCYPPPNFCLKKVRVGKPHRYLTYDKESDNYVFEEIKISNGSLFHASREGVGLKLFMNFAEEGKRV